jgi:hypothetical protein
MWKSELTVELAEEMIDSVESGLSLYRVALLHFVLPATLEGWLDRGAHADADEPYRTFAAAVLQAEASLFMHGLDALRALRFRDGKSTEAFLQYRFPDEFGSKARPAHDPILAGAKRGSKVAQVRKFLRAPDAEFLRIAREEGLAEKLREPPASEGSAPDPATVPSSAPSSEPEDEAPDRPSDEPPPSNPKARRSPR